MTSKQVIWGIVGIVIVVIAIMFAFPLSSYLKSAILNPDINRPFVPLVRHQKSQVHCYDNGTNVCETKKQPFEKEFTIGYLLTQSSSAIAGNPMASLYSCANGQTGKYYVTLNAAECGTANGYNNTSPLGKILTTPSIEAPATLYRCMNTDKTDTLLTDDPRECSLVNYDAPETLGYVASAGYLSQRRLEDLCTSVGTACSQGLASTALCQVRTSLCTAP